jgi:hypothetical protein
MYRDIDQIRDFVNITREVILTIHFREILYHKTSEFIV